MKGLLYAAACLASVLLTGCDAPKPVQAQYSPPAPTAARKPLTCDQMAALPEIILQETLRAGGDLGKAREDVAAVRDVQIAMGCLPPGSVPAPAPAPRRSVAPAPVSCISNDLGGGTSITNCY